MDDVLSEGIDPLMKASIKSRVVSQPTRKQFLAESFERCPWVICFGQGWFSWVHEAQKESENPQSYGGTLGTERYESWVQLNLGRWPSRPHRAVPVVGWYSAHRDVKNHKKSLDFALHSTVPKKY